MLDSLRIGNEYLKDKGIGKGQQQEASDLDKYIDTHLFDINQKPDPETFILYHEDTPIAGRGNLISISGAAKSRKTVIASSIMGCMLNNQQVLGFRSDLKETDTILHIDTEQAYFHYYNTVKRTINLSGLEVPPAHFKSIRTRDAGSSETRVQIMERLFELYKPDICILDGITDMVDDINSNEESTEIMNKLLQLSDNYNALIAVVIHETATTSKMRGAIGTTITNKVENAISVELDKENDIASHVTCKYSRNKKFLPFTIVQDGSNGEVRLAEVDEVQEMQSANNPKTKKQAFKATDIEESLHQKMVVSISNFSERIENKKKVISLITEYSWGIYGRRLSVTESAKVFDHMFQQGLLINNTENQILPVGGFKDKDLPF
jgi:DNA-binding transcriptional ArsR family regulator